MVRAVNPNHFFRIGSQSDRPLQLFPRPEDISGTAHKELWLAAIPQKAEVVAPAIDWRDRQAEADHGIYPRIGTRGPQSDGCSKRKSGENDRQMEFMFQPIQRGANVVHLATPVVVLTVTQAHAAKVEAQGGKSKTV